MSLRSKEVYVSPKTKKRLYWLKELHEATVGETEKIVTVDEIADRLLNKIIEQDYPNIQILEKRLGALEGQLISELLNPTVEK